MSADCWALKGAVGLRFGFLLSAPSIRFIFSAGMPNSASLRNPKEPTQAMNYLFAIFFALWNTNFFGCLLWGLAFAIPLAISTEHLMYIH